MAASAAEYGLLVAGIAALVVVIVFTFGGAVAGSFTHSCTKVASTANISSSC
ncbi:MAG: Flp family type IVb pilin [Marmoricola sp.]